MGALMDGIQIAIDQDRRRSLQATAAELRDEVIAGRIVFQVLAVQIFATFLAFDELPDDEEDDIPMSGQSEAPEQGEENA